MKLTNKDMKIIIDNLVKHKKRTGYYNVSIEYKEITFSMVISTHDNKPFNKKKVRIYGCGCSKDSSIWQTDIAILSPRKAGYTQKEVNSFL